MCSHRTLWPFILQGKAVRVSLTPTAHSFIFAFIGKPFSFHSFFFSFKLKYMLLLIHELIYTQHGLPNSLSVPVLKFRGKKNIYIYNDASTLSYCLRQWEVNIIFPDFFWNSTLLSSDEAYTIYSISTPSVVHNPVPVPKLFAIGLQSSKKIKNKRERERESKDIQPRL